MTDTIFALATGAARAAIAVIRISGPQAHHALAALASLPTKPRQAAVRTLRDPSNGQILDEAMVLAFTAPASFTGEDQVELHLHGGSAVIDGVTKALLQLELRPAQPGEFTRRAFENGKLDLAEAEAIADLVDAETEAQRHQALAQLGGGISRQQAAWRAMLLQASAMLEADIDFPDEDIPSGLEEQARAVLDDLLRQIEAAVSDSRGEQVRDGYRIALIGAPNAGKSSLLNALSRRDVAIVTDRPGTTRDVIEVNLVVQGFKVILADTAGLRDTDDVIEVEGVRRARAWAADASMRMLVIDQAAEEDAWREASDVVQPGDIVVLNKCDQRNVVGAAAEAWAEAEGCLTVHTSAATGDIDELLAVMARTLVSALGDMEAPAVTRARHRILLTDAAQHLRRGLRGERQERLAEDVRLAARALAELVGQIGSEQVLDGVFGAFCIGK